MSRKEPRAKAGPVSRREPYKLSGRATLSDKPPFTPLELHEVLAKALGTRYRPPNDPELVEFCRVLNTWHAWFYAAQEARAHNELIDQAKQMIDTLTLIVPKIRDRLRRDFKASGGNDPFNVWQLQSADKAVAFLADPDCTRFLHHDELPNQARDWRWLAEVLPVDIETAMRSANPHYPNGHSKTGPLARILSAVIPGITGEHVTAKAIGTQLGKILGATAARRRH
jgi:hypothetical protein